MTKVVLSGYYGFHNVGDEAILFSIIKALRAIEPGIEIIVLSNDPVYTANQYHVESVNRWKLAEVTRVIRKSDGLISGGGSLLQDATGMKSIPYYTGIMMIAKFLRKPVFVYAQGIGPIHRKINQKLVKFVLQKVDYLSVRDQESKTFLQKIGVTKRCELVPDPVIGFSYQPNESWLEERGISGSILTVSVRDWPGDQAYKQKMASALDQSGLSIVFVPMHGERDQETSQEVIGMMKEPAYLFPFDASIEDKMQVITESQLLIGMRLHALIFAAVGNTPMIGISYDPKIDVFLSQVSQPKIGDVNENWTAEALVQLINQQMTNLGQEKEHLSKHLSPLKAKANQTAQHVLTKIRQT